MAVIEHTNLTLKDVEHHASRIPDAEVDSQPVIAGLKGEIALAEARLATASKSAHGVGNRARDLTAAALKAERDLHEIEGGQPDLAVAALLGDAGAKEQFGERERRADELRALLRCYKLSPIARGRNNEASVAAVLVRNAVDAVARLEETLAGERSRAKLEIAKQKLTPKG